MISPRLQNVPRPWRIISFVEVVTVAFARLAVEIHISIQDAANVAQVGAAIAGGGASREPENEDECIEDELTPYEPWDEPGGGVWARG